MTITFSLNGKSHTLDMPAGMRLVDLLRDSLEIPSVRASCYQGRCGNCAVILNNHLVYSCLVPVFKIRGAEIITYERFITKDEYQDIERAFKETGFVPCPFCTPGKVLTVQSVLETYTSPTVQEVVEAFSGLSCPCTDFQVLVRATQAAALYRQRRRSERKK